MFFGVNSRQSLPQVEGDDIYTTSNMGRLYDEEMRHSLSSHCHHRLAKSISQYDVTVGDNKYVLATSILFVSTTEMDKIIFKPKLKKFYKYDKLLWLENNNSNLRNISQEAFTFMRSGLTIISAFKSLHIPIDMKHEHLSQSFRRFREESMSYMEDHSRGVLMKLVNYLKEKYS
jgi:hypothetical protein